jgi:hypothetical protein
LVKLNNCNKATSHTIQGCDSVVYNNIVYYSDTAFQSHYNAFNGCDSAHSIVLDVTTFSRDTLIVDTCKYYVWNNSIYTNTGYYTANYGGPAGCDSLVTLDLTIDNGLVQQVFFNDCDSVVFNGISYHQSGEFVQSYSNYNNCDSNYIVTVVIDSVDTSVIYNGINGLYANATNASYVWIDCSNNQVVPGSSNSAFFTATQSGSYACVVTENGCSDTSACYSINIEPNSVSDYSLLSQLYPNPSKGTYHLLLNNTYNNVLLEIKNMQGQRIWNQEYTRLKETTFTLDAAAGVYMLFIQQGNRQQVMQLLKR